MQKVQEQDTRKQHESNPEENLMPKVREQNTKTR
jgi:hypothetical protein